MHELGVVDGGMVGMGAGVEGAVVRLGGERVGTRKVVEAAVVVVVVVNSSWKLCSTTRWPVSSSCWEEEGDGG